MIFVEIYKLVNKLYPKSIHGAFNVHQSMCKMCKIIYIIIILNLVIYYCDISK